MLRHLIRSPAARIRLSCRHYATETEESTSTPTHSGPLVDKATITLREDAYLGQHKCDLPPKQAHVTREEVLALYRAMVVVRRMETAADGLYKSKLIRGFCHLAIGQEAVPIGMEAALTRDDKIITAYRCHGYVYARGGSVAEILGELMGKYEGIAKGKGGSMHMFAPNFYGGNGIVGAQVPLGAGLALSQKYRGEKNCTFALYGDGAANQGQVFEAFNMAKLWNLPVVFTIENNLYGMGTSSKRSSASTDYFSRGDYIPGFKVNGMDVLAVREACKYARECTVSGKGPIVMEIATYRYGGHSMSDPGTTYRTREEIQLMRSRNDPIQGLKQVILQAGLATEADIKAMDKDARAEVDAAVEQCKTMRDPPLEDFWTDIYAKGSEPPYVRGCDPADVHHYA